MAALCRRFNLYVQGAFIVSDPSHPHSARPHPWIGVLVLAMLQNGVALYAVYASRQDVLSDGACLGGAYGTLANGALLAAILVRGMVLALAARQKTIAKAVWDRLLVMGLSTAAAILIGQHAMLRCTV